MYDDELILIKPTRKDAMKRRDPPEQKTTVFCGVQSVSSAEFHRSIANDLRPERVFLVHSFEYDGQREVEFKGERYTVIRSYNTKNFEETALVVERKAVNVNDR